MLNMFNHFHIVCIISYQNVCAGVHISNCIYTTSESAGNDRCAYYI